MDETVVVGFARRREDRFLDVLSACEQCGTMHTGSWRYCWGECEADAKRLAKTRPHPCPVSGTPVTGAMYDKPACKQKAYRERLKGEDVRGGP